MTTTVMIMITVITQHHHHYQKFFNAIFIAENCTVTTVSALKWKQ